MPDSKKDVLIQLASGLEHIHSMQLIHRNIKPENALVWVGYDETSASEKVLMKWADFGLSKRGACSLTGVVGSVNWKAPEVLEVEVKPDFNWDGHRPHGTTKSDVFCEGMVFAYYLLDGKHPYGSSILEIPNNILKGNLVNIQGETFRSVQHI